MKGLLRRIEAQIYKFMPIDIDLCLSTFGGRGILCSEAIHMNIVVNVTEQCAKNNIIILYVKFTN